MQALILAATTPEWISAAATAVLGILGLAFGGWQFWAQGFQLSVDPVIEPERKRIMVYLRNRGRADGVIVRLSLVNGKGERLTPPARANGYFNGEFRPTLLPGGMQMQIRFDWDEPFPDMTRVFVDWGKKERPFTLKDGRLGYAGIPSILPPQSS